MSRKDLTVTAKIKFDSQSFKDVERKIGSLNKKLTDKIYSPNKDIKKISNSQSPLNSSSSKDILNNLRQEKILFSQKKRENIEKLTNARVLDIQKKRDEDSRFKKEYQLLAMRRKADADKNREERRAEAAKQKSQKILSGKSRRTQDYFKKLFKGIGHASGGNFPYSTVASLGLIGAVTYAAFKVFKAGYDATKTDYSLYAQSANTGLSAGALKYFQKGLAPQTGEQLLAAFSQSSQFADFNRFGKLNQIVALTKTMVGNKNAGYLANILNKSEDGVEFQRDVINSTLQRYQSGAFGKVGSPYAKNQANTILQGSFGNDFSSVIESYGKDSRTKKLLDNLTNDDYISSKTSLVSEDNALKTAETAANIQLSASNIFHDSVDKIVTAIRSMGNVQTSFGAPGFAGNFYNPTGNV
jgi:hypothetical protein